MTLDSFVTGPDFDNLTRGERLLGRNLISTDEINKDVDEILYSKGIIGKIKKYLDSRREQKYNNS